MSQPGRTNFVRVSSLPSYYSNGLELFNTFSSVGQIHVRIRLIYWTIHSFYPGYNCSGSNNSHRFLRNEVTEREVRKKWNLLIVCILDLMLSLPSLLWTTSPSGVTRSPWQSTSLSRTPSSSRTPRTSGWGSTSARTTSSSAPPPSSPGPGAAASNPGSFDILRDSTALHLQRFKRSSVKISQLQRSILSFLMVS